MERDPPPSVHAAATRALPVLLVPLVLGAGVAASGGDAAQRFWGVCVLLGVLVGGAALVATGVRGALRQRRRSTATTLPSTVASSPGIGS